MHQTACPFCDDTGWKPVSDGKYQRVERCECRERTRAERLLIAARIPKRYEHCTLSNFDTSFQGADALLAKAKIAAEGFVANYPLEKRGLLLFGAIGTGKTHLAVAVIKQLILDKGARCLFYDYRELLKQIRDSYNPTVAATEMDVLRPVLEIPVLLLDELGAEHPTDWVWDTISYVLNTRYNEKRTTIFTTNYPNGPSAGAQEAQRSEVERVVREETLGDRITDRMRSRLHEMCYIMVRVEGPDYRQRRSPGRSR